VSTLAGMKLLLCFSLIIYILTSRMCHPPPLPHFARSVCSQHKSNISNDNLKNCLMFSLFMLYFLGKFAFLYRHSIQYVPINISLNLIKRNRPSSLNFCRLEIISAFLFLNWGSEELVSVLILLNGNCSFLTTTSINVTMLRNLVNPVDKFFKATLIANLGFCVYKSTL